jgi:uncharacterized protein YcnI
MTRLRAIPAAILVALVAGSAASAHVTVRPSSDPAAAARGEVSLVMPNESQRSDTTSVAVKLPDNTIDAVVPAVTGWRGQIATVALESPVRAGGRIVTTRPDTVTWTGRLAPGRSVALRLRVRVRTGTPRSGLIFRAVQRYADGTVVRWIGPAGSENPAGVLRAPLPVVAVGSAPSATPPVVSPQATITLTRTAAAEASDDGVNGALIGGAAAAAVALGGLAIWVTRRRRNPR